MQGNDIGPFTTSKIACMFEGLIATIPTEEQRRKFLRLRPGKPVTLEDEVRRWKANDLPLKSLLHLTNRLEVSVEVYTYLDYDYVEHIEHWLARKGANVIVYNWLNAEELAEDFKYNRDVRVLYTPHEDDAAIIGIRATVAHPDQTWGI